MAKFDDKAFGYILSNEGGYSNDLNDRGGVTMYGITAVEALRHGYVPGKLTLHEAQTIYRENYWKFDGINDQRVATKMLDMVVNMGAGTKLIQRAAGVKEDAIYGVLTEDAINALDPDTALERLSMVSADYYVSICLRDNTQLRFLKGWIRRAIRRPVL